ncbi:winged helix-turn-helix domain-containing protein [Paraburkholderia bryophila]|uniref:winged helix-turn-helix domain-containing protein n=1 Tax=Paraburkholderia bryophila TaxID=420952 RepID=UPI0038B9F7C3
MSVGTIRRYKAILDAGGVDALVDINVGGRKSALDDNARTWIAKALQGSPRRHGFDADQWTSPTLQAVIEQRFGVLYSRVYVRQLTIDLGVHDRMRSFKTPMRRAPGVLHDDTLSWLAAALRDSPRLHDFDADRWTTPRLITLIERKFQVRYSRRYVWQIVVELGLGHLLTRLRK